MPETLTGKQIRDVAESVGFIRAHETVSTTVYNTKYPNLIGRTLVPADNEAKPGDKVFTYRTFTQVGLAKFVAGYATDLPQADVFGEEASALIKQLGVGFKYTTREARQASNGANLPSMKADAARRAYEAKVDDLIALGDAAHGYLGLLNQTAVSSYTIPNGAAGSPLWASKTGLEKFADLVNIAESVPSTTTDVEQVNTIIVPRNRWGHLHMPMQAGSDTTLATYFKNNYPGVELVSWSKANTAGGSSSARLVAYAKDEQHLKFIEPMPFTILAPQPDGLHFEVPCEGEAGGVVIFFPLSMVYGDGI